jgi:hypothetical protein
VSGVCVWTNLWCVQLSASRVSGDRAAMSFSLLSPLYPSAAPQPPSTTLARPICRAAASFPTFCASPIAANVSLKDAPRPPVMPLITAVSALPCALSVRVS